MTAAPAVPRRVRPGSARSLLLAVLGEMVWPRGGEVWTASLVRALKVCGVGEKAARQALARTAAQGWLVSQRDGRAVRWRLTPLGIRLMERGLARVESLSVPQPEWDGRWLVLHVSVPRERAALRNRLTRRLQWAGFGSPAPGVWLSPHVDRQAEMNELLTSLELGAQAVSFAGPIAQDELEPAEVVARAWPLHRRLPYYEALLERWAGAADWSDPLAEHLVAVDEWQHLPYVDPQLPRELLPADWPGEAATELLASRRTATADRADAAWQDLVDSTRPRSRR